MKFSKQPNGLYCSYSPNDDSFEESNLTTEYLLKEIIKDMASEIARRYIRVLEYSEYDFERIIKEFRLDNYDKCTRMHWEKKFMDMGCNGGQMWRVKERIDQLSENGDLL